MYVLCYRVNVFSDENVQLKKKVEVLETENKYVLPKLYHLNVQVTHTHTHIRSLMVQIKKLQALLASNSGTTTKRTTQVGACLMVRTE